VSSGAPNLSHDDKANLRAQLAQRRWAVYLLAASEASVLILLVQLRAPVPVLILLTVGSVTLFLAALKRYLHLVALAAPHLEP
jgi:hypothetical protein